MSESPALNLKAVLGFGGKTTRSMKSYTDPYGVTFLIYPLGSTVVIKNTQTNTQAFLRGHKGDIQCLALSPCNKYIATGEKCFGGDGKAAIRIWDLQAGIRNGNTADDGGECIHILAAIHAKMVKSVDFSHDSKYLASIGGQDDNSVIVWDVENGTPESGEQVGSNSTICLRWFNSTIQDSNGSYCFVTAGLAGSARIFKFGYDSQQKKYKIHPGPADIEFAKAKRSFTAVCLSPDDKTVIFGTKSGDIVLGSVTIKHDGQVISSINRVIDSRGRTQKGLKHSQFPGGILSLACIPTPQVFQNCTGSSFVLLAGSGLGKDGNGKFAVIADDEGLFEPTGKLKPKQFVSAQEGPRALLGGIASIAYDGSQGTVWIGTNKGNIYSISLDKEAFKSNKGFAPVLVGTSHYQPVNAVAFPLNCSKLFVTASEDESIRVWNVEAQMELLRIQVPGTACKCIALTPEGTHILSGWDDGKIRGFGPESGKITFVINDAHNYDCTAVAACTDGDQYAFRLVSGGKDGQVRWWNVEMTGQNPKCRMLKTLKEHRQGVNCVKVTNDSTHAVSASDDGFCIVWSMEMNGNTWDMKRKRALNSNTCFKSLVYFPDESQLLTTGTDHTICYWDPETEEKIREIECSDKALKCIDTTDELFAVAGEDKEVRVFSYDNGTCIGTGVGHSGSIESLQISPDAKFVVTCGAEGAIMIWDMPEFYEDA